MAEEVKNTEETKPTLTDVFDDRKITEESDNDTDNTQTTEKRRPRRRRRVVQNLKCPLCEAGIKDVSYKDVYQLKKYTSVKGKIISTEKSGVCHKHQRKLTSAIKRARFMALLPYSSDE
jgi:small subunit ribosomal protein S18